MKLYNIECGNFKLDGGAMFGVVPKSLWQKTNSADGNNLIEMATRSLLIEDGNELTLVDCGLGNKQDDKFLSHYHLWGNYNLDSSLKANGFHRDDITNVFLTHLHFDHCGGAIQRNTANNLLEPAFKNAKFWSNQSHWEWAINPNSREKASFLPDNILPIKESGQLNYISLENGKDNYHSSGLGFDFITVDGHTEKQMLPVVKYKDKTIVFMADLIPTVGHIPLVYLMGYDTRPLITMKEKLDFLTRAVKENYYLFFEHDTHNQMCTLKNTEKGIRLDKTYQLKDIL